jgi:Ala-tRNA(Pro) deacylase
MAIAQRLQYYLDDAGLDYEVLHHPRSTCSMETARHAAIPPGRMAKPVLLEDDRGYVLAVVPASCRIDLDALEAWLHRHLELATERDLEELFPDCATGAVPPVGAPYHLAVVYDEVLAALPDIYFEAGDHTDVVHMASHDFCALLGTAPSAHFSHPH